VSADAPELSYVQPLFLEEQRASQVLGGFVHTIWTIAAAQALACLITIALLFHRLPNAVIGVIVGATVVVVAVIMLATSFVGVTVVEPAELQIRLSGWGLTVWKRTIRMADIAVAEPTLFRDSRAVLQLMQGDVNFMTGKECVRLRLKSHRNIVIGSQRPQELLEAVRATLSVPADANTMPDMDRGGRDGA
jgi:hypothetical protein